MVLLEEVCHCGVAFEVSYAQLMPTNTVHFLWPVDQEVELSLAPWLPACRHVLT